MRELLALPVLALVLGASCAACSAAVPAVTATKIEDATRLTAASYAHQDAGTAGAALIREAHCDLQSTIGDLKLAPVDSGIPCQ